MFLVSEKHLPVYFHLLIQLLQMEYRKKLPKKTKREIKPENMREFRSGNFRRKLKQISTSLI